jgi:hypothetical protein
MPRTRPARRATRTAALPRRCAKPNGTRLMSDAALLLSLLVRLLVCHARTTGGWLLLRHEALVGPRRTVGGTRERVVRSRVVR